MKDVRLLQEVCVCGGVIHGAYLLGFYVHTIYSPKLPWNSSLKDHQTSLCLNHLWKHLPGFKYPL